MSCSRSLSFVVLLAGALVASCGKDIFSPEDYAVSYETFPGVAATDGDVGNPPGVSVLVAGPDGRDWWATLSGTSGSYSFTVTTGSAVFSYIPAHVLERAVGMNRVELTVSDARTGYILFRQPMDIEVLAVPNEKPAFTIASVQVVSDLNGVRYLRSGDNVVLSVGEGGLFVVRPSVWDDRLSLMADLRPSDGGLALASPDAVRRENGAFLVPFRVSSEDSGSAAFSLCLDDAPYDVFSFSWLVSGSHSERPLPVDAERYAIESVVLVSDLGETKTVRNGEEVSFAARESGLIVIRPGEWDDRLSLKAVSTPAEGGLTLGSYHDLRCENGAFLVPFVAGEAGSGRVDFQVSLSGFGTEPFSLVWRISDAPPVPPVPEIPSLQLSVPPLCFVERECVILVSLSGVVPGREYTLVLLSDGAELFRSSYTHDGLPTPITIGEKTALKGGVHILEAVAAFADDGSEVMSEPVRMKVSRPSFKWLSEDGSRCTGDLEFTSLSGYKLLAVDLGCEDSLVESVRLVDKASRTECPASHGDARSFVVGHRPRGERLFELTAKTETGTYVWDVAARLVDVWTIEPFVNGKTLYGRLSGPEEKISFSLELTMRLVLCAYIPYQEAVIVDGRHVVQSRGQYVDIGYEEESRSFAAGTVCGNLQLWSGNLSMGLSYGRSQASKVGVVRDGSSRWVENGGVWTKEYFTPVPVPHIDLYVFGNLTGGDRREFVSVRMKYDSLDRWLASEGFSVRWKEYWDGR